MLPGDHVAVVASFEQFSFNAIEAIGDDDLDRFGGSEVSRNGGEQDGSCRQTEHLSG